MNKLTHTSGETKTQGTTIPYNNVSYQLVRNKYLSTGDVGFLGQLDNIWRDNRLNNIKFHGTKYGRVAYFRNCLIKSLGEEWSDRVLDPADDLSDVPAVERLGRPGKLGTTIKINCEGIDYAVKVAKKGTYCGSGIVKTLAEEQEIILKDPRGKWHLQGEGLLHEARLQQLASQYKVTVPVEAVGCGGEDEVSFIVMLPLKTRLVDHYNHGDTLSLKHQKQLWELFKTLDEDVGISHNDGNCLNIMLDSEENLRLIDFDLSVTIDEKLIVKYGPYPNLNFLSGVSCLNGMANHKISPGQKLLANYHRLFGSKFKTGININNIRKFRQMSGTGEYNYGRGMEYENKETQEKMEAKKKLRSRLIPYETLEINWDQLPEAEERTTKSSGNNGSVLKRQNKGGRRKSRRSRGRKSRRSRGRKSRRSRGRKSRRSRGRKSRRSHRR